jgi:hypothetical protein
MEDVKEEAVLSETATETTTETVVEPEVKAGDKTEPNLLLKSLHEEREKRRELEKQLELAKEVEITAPISDEGKYLKKQVDSLQEKIALKEVTEQFPALKDKMSDFDEFRKDYPGVELGKAAKLFLAEKDLLETPKPRLGLEKPSGGGRTAPSAGMTVEEFDKLRSSNYRKYVEILKSGKAPRT